MQASGPSILSPGSPPSRDFWLRLTQPPASRALLFSGRLHFLSTPSPSECPRKHPPQGEESLAQQRSMQPPWGRQKQEEGERAFSILDPRQLCGCLRQAGCFSTQTSVVLVVIIYKFSLAINMTVFCGMVPLGSVWSLMNVV